MRQIIISFYLTILVSIIGVKAYAHDIEVKNADGVTIYYNWINNKTELAVTFHGTDYNSNQNHKYSGTVVIPESVNYSGNNYRVTSIGNHAFYWCTGLTNISIPYSVTSIGGAAFCVCTGLTSVTIPNSVSSVGGLAFCDCTGLTSITIPNSVISIGSGAFKNTRWYENQKDGLLYLCNWLLGYKGNKPTGNIQINNNTKGIAESAFKECTELTNITIPNSVTSIGNSAFKRCTGLISVQISDLEAWCKISFESSYANPLYYAHHLYLGEEEIKNLMIPKSVTKILDNTFYGCSGLISVTIPNSVTSIGSAAFCVCTGLTSVTIPNSVSSIEGAAFANCTGLTNITIPNSVTSIGNSAFERCTGLTSINIPNSVTSIEGAAFYGCTGLTSINIPNSVTSIGGNAFSNTKWYENQKDGLLYLCNWLLGYKGDKPTGNVQINNNTKGIANGVFKDCTELTSINIPNSVTSIGSYAFYGCSRLTSIIIPNSVTSIGTHAFYDCSSLTSITISSSATSIGNWAFYGCNKLTIVTSLNSIPPTVNANTFNNYSASLQVPEGSKTNYKNADYWKNFKNIVEIDPSGIQTITLDKEINTPVYDLNGRRLNEPSKGINIIGRKKVVVK